MSWVISVVGVVLAFCLVVAVHELGHFAAARFCGVKVLRFSIGLGRPLWMRELGPDRTQWVLSAIPVGGYVRMLDESQDDEPIDEADRPRAYNRQSVWARSLIVAAGPAANFLLAIGIYWVLGVVGSAQIRPVLAQPPVGSLAHRAGVQAGDEVIAFEGHEVASLSQLRWELLQAAMDRGQYVMTVRSSSDETRQLSLNTAQAAVDLSADDLIGAMGFIRALWPVRVQAVADDSPAQRAGLQVGDQWLALDGEPVTDARALIEQIRAQAGRTVSAELLREGEVYVTSVTIADAISPEGQRHGSIGAALAAGESVWLRTGAVASLAEAVARTWQMSSLSVRMFVLMIMGEASWKNISGPVTIASYAGQSATIGLTPYLTFLALFSIGLGVINLLPIPVLDGGQLLYHAAEICMGQAPPQWALDLGQRVGILVLLMLMALALYNDLSRFF